MLFLKKSRLLSLFCQFSWDQWTERELIEYKVHDKRVQTCSIIDRVLNLQQAKTVRFR